MARRYTKEVEDKVNELIPLKIRQALAEHGWNVFGVYEDVESVIKAIQSSGQKAFKGRKQRK